MLMMVLMVCQVLFSLAWLCAAMPDSVLKKCPVPVEGCAQ